MTPASPASTARGASVGPREGTAAAATPVLGSGHELPAEPPAVVFVSLPVGLGGSTRSLANVLGYLDGTATRVLAAPPEGRFPTLVAERGAAEWHLPVVDPGVGLALLRRARTALRLARALRPHRGRVRALHANGFNELAAALPAALLWRLPVVVWVHNISAGRAVRLMARVWGLIGRRAEVRWAAVSPLARDLVVDSGLAEAREVAIVPNPIDPDDVVAPAARSAAGRATAPAEGAGAASGPDGRPVTVAYLGAPRDYKGFHFLPDLVERTAERVPVRWLLFSRQSDDHLTGTWDRLRHLEAEGRVSIEGKLTDVGAAYARADVVVCPSVHESFCRVAAEAMLNGIPVAGSDLEPVRALLGEGDAGLLFPVGDLDAGAEAIARLARDPGLRDRLGRAGRVRAGAYAPAAIGARFVELLGLGTIGDAGDPVPA